MRGVQPPLNVKTAEKLFNRKASPDTKLSAGAFLKKEAGQVKAGAGKVIRTVEDKAAKAFHKATQFGAHLADNTLGKVARKITGPTVRVMKIQDEKMRNLEKKAKAGELN